MAREVKKKIGDWWFTAELLPFGVARGLQHIVLESMGGLICAAEDRSVLIPAAQGRMSEGDLTKLGEAFLGRTKACRSEEPGDTHGYVSLSQPKDGKENPSRTEVFGGDLALYAEYLDWCVAENFGTLIEKSGSLLKKLQEQAAKSLEIAQQAASQDSRDSATKS